MLNPRLDFRPQPPVRSANFDRPWKTTCVHEHVETRPGDFENSQHLGARQQMFVVQLFALSDAKTPLDGIAVASGVLKRAYFDHACIVSARSRVTG